MRCCHSNLNSAERAICGFCRHREYSLERSNYGRIEL